MTYTFRVLLSYPKIDALAGQRDSTTPEAMFKKYVAMIHVVVSRRIHGFASDHFVPLFVAYMDEVM
jgi:hypothetical protein